LERQSFRIEVARFKPFSEVEFLPTLLFRFSALATRSVKITAAGRKALLIYPSALGA
jgi:hypothetical protein